MDEDHKELYPHYYSKERGNKLRKLKLMTIVGTRPEIIKLSEIIKSAISISNTFWYTQARTMTIL